MADGVADEWTDNTGDAVHAVVGDETQGLFSELVPDSEDEDEAWVDNGFEGAEEEAVGGDANKARACWDGEHQDAPACTPWLIYIDSRFIPDAE